MAKTNFQKKVCQKKFAKLNLLKNILQKNFTKKIYLPYNIFNKQNLPKKLFATKKIFAILCQNKICWQKTFAKINEDKRFILGGNITYA